jgi:nucleoside-diphosphate-sugar epimerase
MTGPTVRATEFDLPGSKGGAVPNSDLATGKNDRKQRVIVFGGSGFVGRELIARLSLRGCDVTVADIVPTPSNAANRTYSYCDVREKITISRDRPYDRVYVLAAVHRTPGHQPFEYYETNVGGALNVARWCASGGEQSITFTSSIAVYGPSETPKSEQSEPAPISDYGRSKLMAERILLDWQAERPGRRLAVLRPAVVFGPGEGGNFTRLAAALAKHRFAYPGRRDVVKACAYVGDLVAAMDYLQHAPDDVTIANFCYPQQYTIEEICSAFHRVAGFPLPRSIPRAALTVGLATLGAVNPGDRGPISATRIRKLTGSTNIVPEALMKAGFEWPTDLEGGLRAWAEATGGTYA